MAKKKNTPISVSQEKTAQAQHVFEHYHQITHNLHASKDQKQVETALTEINNLPESAQLALLKELSKEHQVDAADVLIALNELSPLKSVRKEARRSLIRLEGTKIYPRWKPPIDRTPPISAIQPSTNPPRFWKGLVDTDATGEAQLLLFWEQGEDYKEVCILGFYLNLRHEGVKDSFTNIDSKRGTERYIARMAVKIPTLEWKNCSLVEGHRLLRKALIVHARHGTTPPGNYRSNLPLINQLIMEVEGVALDEKSSILHGLDPQRTVISFIEVWAREVYGTAYDLLSHDSPLREGLSRDEWIERRKAWAEEAEPSGLEPGYIIEHEHHKSILWLPESFNQGYSAIHKEVEAGWSLEMDDIPLSDPLPELPQATAIYEETQRHWFWASYTLVQENGDWRIQSMTDESIIAQNLSIEDLQKEQQELDDQMGAFVKKYARAKALQLDDEDTKIYLKEHSMSKIDQARLNLIDRYWKAANYLTVGQIYLQDNPLLKEPLRPEHIKPRLLGHWGTSPGLSFIYVHLNRLIKDHNVNMIYLAGPGHGGPAILANVYLEGTYTEIYPEISQNAEGIRRLFRQFSTPGGIPSHVSVPTPGSIHEGGELGYVLVHAFGAAFDNPDLIVTAVIGDGEAETGPLEGSWKSIKFLNPVRDGAVLPILHLNEYKISGPTVLGRADDESIRQLISGHGYDVYFIEGDDPMTMHQAFAETLETCYTKIRQYQKEARQHGYTKIPRWPAIILRSPKGWTGPKEVDDKPIEGTFRSHQVPVAEVKTNPKHLKILEDWMRSYKPEDFFDKQGHLIPELAALAPRGDRRMGANPHANGGKLLVDLDMPDFTAYAIDVKKPATQYYGNTQQLGKLLRDIFTRNAKQHNFRLFSPDETNSNRLGDVFEVENRTFEEKIIPIDDHLSPYGRVMEVLSEHLCEGWLEGYLLTGRHGLFASYEAFAMIIDSMMIQHSKWLEGVISLHWREPIASLNILLTSTCWRNDHNGFSHQGPGLIDTALSRKGAVARIYLPPDANCLLSVADHCFRSRNYVNLIVIDKQPHLQFLTMQQAIEHCTRGLSIWHWASNDDKLEPDIVLACAGDVMTMETVAAAWWLRHHIPELKVRVVNIVDLMTLYIPDIHPHGLDNATFIEQFTENRPVVFAFHGYQRAVHQLIHGRPNPDRFHVRGFNEQGTTTTPFDMVVLNGVSRYHLCILAMQRAERVKHLVPSLIQECNDLLAKHSSYIRTNFEDMPEVRDWVWTD